MITKTHDLVLSYTNNVLNLLIVRRDENKDIDLGYKTSAIIFLPCSLIGKLAKTKKYLIPQSLLITKRAHGFVCSISHIDFAGRIRMHTLYSCHTPYLRLFAVWSIIVQEKYSLCSRD